MTVEEHLARMLADALLTLAKISAERDALKTAELKPGKCVPGNHAWTSQHAGWTPPHGMRCDCGQTTWEGYGASLSRQDTGE